MSSTAYQRLPADDEESQLSKAKQQRLSPSDSTQSQHVKPSTTSSSHSSFRHSTTRSTHLQHSLYSPTLSDSVYRPTTSLSVATIITLIFLLTCLFIALALKHWEQQTTQDADNQLNLNQTMIIETLHNANIPSTSIIVFTPFATLYSLYTGPPLLNSNNTTTPDTIYLLASVSKLFVLTTVLKAVEDGVVDLDVDINFYLNRINVTITHPNFPSPPLTLRHLLTHTAALNDSSIVNEVLLLPFDSPFELRDFLHNYASVDGCYYSEESWLQDVGVGEVFHYSSVGVAVAALVVEAATGVEFANFTRKVLFEKLDVADETAWKLNEFDTARVQRLSGHYTASESLDSMQRRFPFLELAEVESGNVSYVSFNQYSKADWPAATLRTTTGSVVKLMQLYMNHGFYNNQQILQNHTIESAFTVSYPSLKSGQALIWYGLNCSTTLNPNRTCWQHTGSDPGVSTAVVMNEERSVGLVILSNADWDKDYGNQQQKQKVRDAFRTVWTHVLDAAEEASEQPQ